jgi:hypothetical protein
MTAQRMANAAEIAGKLVRYASKREGVPLAEIARYLPYFESELKYCLLFRNSMQSLSMLLEQTFGLDADARKLSGLDRLKDALQRLSPYTLLDLPDLRVLSAADDRQRLVNYLLFFFNDLIQPIFRAQALLAAYYPELGDTPIALQLDSSEKALRAVMAIAGIYPHKIELLSPRCQEHERVVQHGEPDSLASHPRFRLRLKQCLSRLSASCESKAGLATDVRLWGYSVKKQPQLNQKTQVYVRDHL